MKRNLLLIVVIIIIVLVIWFVVFPRSYEDESDTNPILAELREDLIALNPEYGKIPIKSCDSAFTENKSMICIVTHDPKTKLKYDRNILRYVLYHELAHMTSETYGHDKKFQRNFSTILRAAVDGGRYDPDTVIPHDYGGMTE